MAFRVSEIKVSNVEFIRLRPRFDAAFTRIFNSACKPRIPVRPRLLAESMRHRASYLRLKPEERAAIKRTLDVGEKSLPRLYV